MAIIKKLASQDYVVTKVETEVAEEVTTSLATAKESGDFKGEKGDKGDTGADGKTPVRGTDYWTDADKAEIKSYVDEAILGGAW